MAKSRFKKIIHKIHLWLGLSSGLIVCITALSGCLLSFEDELDRIFDPVMHVPDKYTNSKVSLDNIVANIQNNNPDYQITQLFLFSDPDKTYLIRALNATDEVRLLSVNPYTGAIQKNVNFNHRFFIIILHLHRYLLINEIGQIINGIATICFVILLVSGLIIWIPKRLKNIKQRLKVKWNASRKRLNWDLHLAPGFYVIPLALLIAITGLVWSFDWVEDGVYLIFDGKRKEPITFENIGKEKRIYTEESLSLSALKRQADSIFNFEGNHRFIFQNSEKIERIRVIKEETGAIIPNKRSQLYFDVKSNKIIKILPYDESTTGEKIRRMVLPLHTGTIFGMFTKILFFLASLIVASLFVTGFFIWYNRTYAKKKDRKKNYSV